MLDGLLKKRTLQVTPNLKAARFLGIATLSALRSG